MSATEEMKRYQCYACPYVSTSLFQIQYHRQFHGHGNAPYKCNSCYNYKVPRPHMLRAHSLVHYKNAAEIGLVWVLSDGCFRKMFKCRWCPHVNIRRRNIRDHEKMHKGRRKFNCIECSFTCDNRGALVSHAKNHDGSFGEICSLVDPSKSDEEQIKSLSEELMEEREKSEELMEEGKKSEELTVDGEKSEELMEEGKKSEELMVDGEKSEELMEEGKKSEELMVDGEKSEELMEERGKSVALPQKALKPKRKKKAKCRKTRPSPPPPSPPLTNLEIQLVMLDELERKRKLVKEDNIKNMKYCKLCPYMNLRKDCLKNHERRHFTLSGVKYGLDCEHCDYSTTSLNLLRKHTRIHFKPLQRPQPEAYMLAECLEIVLEDEDTNTPEVVFKECEDGTFEPPINDEEAEGAEGGVKMYIDANSGEFVEEEEGS